VHHKFLVLSSIGCQSIDDKFFDGVYLCAMPYVSDAQRRFFHSPGAKRAGISGATVREYDKASKGLNLPGRLHPKKKAKRG